MSYRINIFDEKNVRRSYSLSPEKLNVSDYFDLVRIGGTDATKMEQPDKDVLIAILEKAVTDKVEFTLKDAWYVMNGILADLNGSVVMHGKIMAKHPTLDQMEDSGELYSKEAEGIDMERLRWLEQDTNYIVKAKKGKKYKPRKIKLKSGTYVRPHLLPNDFIVLGSGEITYTYLNGMTFGEFYTIQNYLFIYKDMAENEGIELLDPELFIATVMLKKLRKGKPENLPYFELSEQAFNYVFAKSKDIQDLPIADFKAMLLHFRMGQEVLEQMTKPKIKSTTESKNAKILWREYGWYNCLQNLIEMPMYGSIKKAWNAGAFAANLALTIDSDRKKPDDPKEN